MRMSDWSSDVCSSDLLGKPPTRNRVAIHRMKGSTPDQTRMSPDAFLSRQLWRWYLNVFIANELDLVFTSSEERRVGIVVGSKSRCRRSLSYTNKNKSDDSTGETRYHNNNNTTD